MKSGIKVRFAVWSIVGLLAVATLAWLVYPDVEFYFRMRHIIRGAPYVTFHVYESGKDYKVARRETSHELWAAVTIFTRTPASDEARSSCNTSSNPCLAYAGFPIDIGDGKSFDCPIYVYKDGTTLWGIPPKRSRYFHMPEFRDKVMIIIADLERR